MAYEKVKKAKGCNKFDCTDYPRYSNDEAAEVVINSNCRLCKHFKKFDLYGAQK